MEIGSIKVLGVDFRDSNLADVVESVKETFVELPQFEPTTGTVDESKKLRDKYDYAANALATALQGLWEDESEYTMEDIPSKIERIWRDLESEDSGYQGTAAFWRSVFEQLAAKRSLFDFARRFSSQRVEEGSLRLRFRDRLRSGRTSIMTVNLPRILHDFGGQMKSRILGGLRAVGAQAKALLGSLRERIPISLPFIAAGAALAVLGVIFAPGFAAFLPALAAFAGKIAWLLPIISIACGFLGVASGVGAYVRMTTA